jgi:hypothetical protein
MGKPLQWGDITWLIEFRGTSGEALVLPRTRAPLPHRTNTRSRDSARYPTRYPKQPANGHGHPREPLASLFPASCSYLLASSNPDTCTRNTCADHVSPPLSFPTMAAAGIVQAQAQARCRWPSPLGKRHCASLGPKPGSCSDCPCCGLPEPVVIVDSPPPRHRLHQLIVP